MLLVALALTSFTGAVLEDPPAVWRPAPGLSWHWQLDGALDLDRDVDVYDVDLFDTPTAVIGKLQARGVKVICYLSAGSWEPYRPDAHTVPEAAIGGPLPGWPDERWLDIRHEAVLAMMVRRLWLAAAKGCDGVELDNMQSWIEPNTGFWLTAYDQIAFALTLFAEGRRRGLAVGLKNDLPQMQALLPDLDFVIVEQCYEYDECDPLDAVVAAGKAAFVAEYKVAPGLFCPDAKRRRFGAIHTTEALDGPGRSCE